MFTGSPTQFRVPLREIGDVEPHREVTRGAGCGQSRVEVIRRDFDVIRAVIGEGGRGEEEHADESAVRDVVDAADE